MRVHTCGQVGVREEPQEVLLGRSVQRFRRHAPDEYVVNVGQSPIYVPPLEWGALRGGLGGLATRNVVVEEVGRELLVAKHFGAGDRAEALLGEGPHVPWCCSGTRTAGPCATPSRGKLELVRDIQKVSASPWRMSRAARAYPLRRSVSLTWNSTEGSHEWLQ